MDTVQSRTSSLSMRGILRDEAKELAKGNEKPIGRMRVHWKTHESASGETALTCEKEKEGKEQQMFLMQARDRAFPFRVFSRGAW
ncbi:hypothetical protein NC652_005603 [Populus alba x Populus x berolinensis]|nr:hypothetical protein NC652_005603 [Populus alba x Populus x berolinensis]